MSIFKTKEFHIEVLGGITVVILSWLADRMLLDGVIYKWLSTKITVSNWFFIFAAIILGIIIYFVSKHYSNKNIKNEFPRYAETKSAFLFDSKKVILAWKYDSTWTPCSIGYLCSDCKTPLKLEIEKRTDQKKPSLFEERTYWNEDVDYTICKCDYCKEIKFEYRGGISELNDASYRQIYRHMNLA